MQYVLCARHTCDRMGSSGFHLEIRPEVPPASNDAERCDGSLSSFPVAAALGALIAVAGQWPDCTLRPNNFRICGSPWVPRQLSVPSRKWSNCARRGGLIRDDTSCCAQFLRLSEAAVTDCPGMHADPGPFSREKTQGVAPRRQRRAEEAVHRTSSEPAMARGLPLLLLLASAFALALAEEHAPAGPRDGVDTYFWNSVTNEVTWEVSFLYRSRIGSHRWLFTHASVRVATCENG